MIHFTPGKRHVSKIRPYFLRTFWLSAIKRAHANMRSLNNGWQPARPSKRTCVLFMAGNQHVLQSEHASLNGWQAARPSKRTYVRLMVGNQNALQNEHARKVNGVKTNNTIFRLLSVFL